MEVEIDRNIVSEFGDAFVESLVFPARYVCFANFRLDLERRELFRNSERVRLQSKVYQILLVLLSNAGNVVTREEVRKRLWADGFHVNFDANVNTTMNKLRQVLGDSPDNPQFVATIPRRGYCFIAPVEFVDAARSAFARPERSLADRPVESAPFVSRLVNWPDALPPVWRVLSCLFAGMLVGALLMFVWFSIRNHKGLVSAKEAAIHFQTQTPQIRR